MKLGVFGGTFDPPHLGHLVAASEACDALGLDRVVWIPSASHPFKGGAVRTPPGLRLEMVRAAIAGDPRFEASGLELERAGPSYTVDTLRALADARRGASLFLLIGADNLRDWRKWREPDEIARLATLVVAERGGESVEAEDGVEAVAVAMTRIDVSATEVRRRVAEGKSIRYLVPDSVLAVVEREGLYRAAPSLEE
ncbi:MAG TPA: nicotinate-nucleotide adenylyltransferase [Longimicrobium sp.]|nr:nicotinate-nucleotide adenylyltransferase [Longimicrobium sp.]